MSSQEIVRAALALPARSKASLAAKLLASLEKEQRKKIDRAWAEEVDRRVRAFRAGKTRAIPAEEVFAALEHRKRG